MCDVNVTGANASTIESIANKRLAQARGFGYLGFETSAPLMHLSSGELGSIIFSEKYWPVFQRFFKAKKTVLQTKLDEIGSIRNALAHFRPIKFDDVEVIKQNSKHIMIGAEDCLSQVISAGRVVPTNTKDDWYKSLAPIALGPTQMQILQSDNEEWIRFSIIYRPTLKKLSKYGTSYAQIDTLNINAKNVLKNDVIRNLCIYCSEDSFYAGVRGDDVVDTQKMFSLGFPRSTVELEFEKIGENLKEIMIKIHEETELVESDHLARGELVRLVSVRGRYNEQHKYWSFESDPAYSPVIEGDPSEYWGIIPRWQNEFVTTASRFPWMTSDISKDPSPF